MHFLPDVYVTCEVCRGKRYNEATLRVKWKDRSIADVLETVGLRRAGRCSSTTASLRGILQTLDDVGLGYIALGQSATTLSGGEAQRIKLSRELAKRDTGRTFYLLDEPTTGLHFEDVRKLLAVLDRLVDAGNTVLVIEHNLDVIKTADYVIDLGPEGGARGGEVVAAGTPEEVARVAGSYTGQFLAPLLGIRRARAPRPPRESLAGALRAVRPLAGVIRRRQVDEHDSDSDLVERDLTTQAVARAAHSLAEPAGKARRVARADRQALDEVRAGSSRAGARQDSAEL